MNGGTYLYGNAFVVRDTFGILTTPGDNSTFVATDPTTVTFTVRSPNGTLTTYVFGVDAEVTNPSVGVYELRQGPLTYAGGWTYAVAGTGAVEATLEGDWTILPSSVFSPQVAELMSTPCTPWCDAQDAWIRCGEPMVTLGEGTLESPCPVDMTPFAQMASWLLFELSGRLYSGRCERTVRPCGDTPCGFQILPRGYVIWPGDWGYGTGWGWSGMNWNWPDYGGCSCVPLDRINLAGYPVREILEVKIDGVVLDEFDLGGTRNWRLDKNRFLTRMADADGNAQRWPACQRLDMDDTEPGTFAVTYAYGQDPPLFGSLAAAEIACEIYRSTTGAACELPSGTIRITRQGVTIDKLAALGWFRSRTKGWQTGLPSVDAFLNGANPYGLTRRPMMMAPGNRRGRFAQSVGP